MKRTETYNLLVLHPDLCKEWNYSKNEKDPALYTPGSDKKVWWTCKKNHTWKSTIKDRAKGSGCPYCSGYFPIVGETDLLTINPELCKEWNYGKNKKGPEFYCYRSNKKVSWICKEGHVWNATIDTRSTGSKCPICVGKKIQIGFNDLLTINPELCKEWNYKKNKKGPEHYSSGHNKKVWWICEKGHEWKDSVSHRKNNRGCPYCSGKRVLVGFNDLKTTHPNLCLEWNYKKNINTPEFYSKGSTQKNIWWICKNKHEWTCTINARTSGNQGCPYCSGRRVLVGFNDLLTINPELCKEWNYKKNKKTPKNYTKGSNKKVWWICSEGHEWISAICDRSSGKNCPNCVYKSQKITGEILKENFSNFKINPEFRIREPVINEEKKIIRRSTIVDFKLSFKKIIIFVEYNGFQHYEKAYFHKSEEDFIIQQQRDRWLRNYCKENNIFLIEIDGRKYVTKKEIEFFLLEKIEKILFY